MTASKPATWREAILRMSEWETGYIGFETLLECFQETQGLFARDYEEFDRRFKKHWIHKWYCTDTWVGIAIISLDGEAVAIFGQEGRKCDPQIEFVSEQCANQTLKALKELSVDPEYGKPAIVNLDEKLDEGWFENGRHQGDVIG